MSTIGWSYAAPHHLQDWREVDRLLREREAARVYVHDDKDPRGPPPLSPKTAS
jgi:hypothetical protein